MTCFSKINLVNKYKEPRVVYEKEIIEKKTDLFGNETIKTKEVKKLYTPMYCNVDDELKIITDNAGAWRGCIIVENKNGERFTINWSDIKLDFWE